MRLITGFFMAWGNFCAIPCPVKKWDEKARIHMLYALPVLGLLIGIIWVLLFVCLFFLDFHIALKAAIMTAYPFMVTGFIHLDGFMDCNDAILSRRPMEERQEILKDSHVGAFAVISTILLFMGFFAAMWTFMENAKGADGLMLAGLPVIARLTAMRGVLKYQPMETSQYSDSFEQGRNTWAGVAALILFFAILFAAGQLLFDEGSNWNKALTMAAFGYFISWCSAEIAVESGRKQLGGMSGDIAGYSIVFGEFIGMLFFAISL